MTLDPGKINGVFSDNVLTLLSGKSRVVRFDAESLIQVKVLKYKRLPQRN